MWHVVKWFDSDFVFFKGPGCFPLWKRLRWKGCQRNHLHKILCSMVSNFTEEVFRILVYSFLCHFHVAVLVWLWALKWDNCTFISDFAVDYLFFAFTTYLRRAKITCSKSLIQLVPRFSMNNISLVGAPATVLQYCVWFNHLLQCAQNQPVCVEPNYLVNCSRERPLISCVILITTN